MIVHLKHNDINKTKWDDCISHSFNGNAYVKSWYLDLVHEDWEALIEDDYQRVMPLTLKTKYGITYFYQPFFTQQFGVFSKKILNSDIIDTFIDKIPKHIKLIDVNFNSFNNIINDKYNTIRNTNYLLDLISDYPKLKSKYSTNTKRNIKKSLKSNLSFIKNIKPENVINLFKNNKGKDITSWNDSNYAVIQRIMYTSIHKGIGFTCGVYTDYNEICAAAFFLVSNNHLIFLFSGANEIAKSNGAMPMLIDTIISENSGTPLILDFEGSNNANLARFYRGFGAQKTSYTGLKINRLNFFQKTGISIAKKILR